MLRYPNPEQVYCFLCMGLHLTKEYKCEVHGFGSKKCKPCSHTIAQFYNCDWNHFASVSTCLKHQWVIQTAIMGRAEWGEGEQAVQEAGIAIEAGEDFESIVDEIATIDEEIDFLAGADPATMELTTDEEEDTDEHMDGTIPEYWADAGVDSA